MNDFIEIMDRCAYDVDKASAEMHVETRTLPEIINDMLEEAGLDAVENVQPKSAEPDNK